MIVPKGLQDLTPQWLTQALRETGTIDRASVVSVEAHELAGHAGITGQLARLHLAYDLQEEGAPRTLIAKLPLVASTGIAWPGREVRFYREIAPQIETFPLSKVNDALDHLRAGSARYRVVLEAD